MTTSSHSNTIRFVSAFIIFAAIATYSFMNARHLQGLNRAVADNAATAAQLRGQLNQSETQYKTIAEAAAKSHADFSKKIESILPPDENYTDLTRQFDNFFAANDRPGNPIIQSSLTFGKGGLLKGVEGIGVLPVTMNIDGTRENFFKFLEFVNNSGSLETGTRLLEITSINLNFPEEGEVLKENRQKLSFNVNLSAYYQLKKVAR